MTSPSEPPVLRAEHLDKSFKVPRARTSDDPRRERLSLRRDRFHALRDISFAVPRGRTLGVIGANGSGKSTLLKILAGVMQADRGMIERHGRVGALLELGAGFHPDLTGIENVFLNGALLGLQRREVNRLIPDIIAFAELEHFMDMPVRHFSSGMAARLGFAMATRLTPEILLMDETFAAGDAAFQAKALGHIAAAKSAGCTIVLVSHNLEIMLQLADEVLWLERGRTRRLGPVREVLAEYRRSRPVGLDHAENLRSALGLNAVFEDADPQGRIITIARVGATADSGPGTPAEARAEAGGELALAGGRQLRLELELEHPGARPAEAWLETAWVRDDELVVGQSRTRVALPADGPRSRWGLRFDGLPLIEGVWQPVVAIAPVLGGDGLPDAATAPRDAKGRPYAWYHRFARGPAVRLTAPNQFEVRVAFELPVHWTVEP